MPRAVALAIAALVFGVPVWAEDSAYFVEYVNGDLVRFPIDSPASQTVIGTYAPGVVGLDFGPGGALYALRESGAVEIVDPDDASSVNVGTATPTAGQIWTGLAYDTTTSTMYASSTDGATVSTLYTIDLGTGAATVVGATNVAEAIVDIAVDVAGNMYAYDVDGNQIHAVDKTDGAVTLIGPTGYVGTGPWHGMDIQPGTNGLFLLSHNGINSHDELRSVNVTSGATSVVGNVDRLSGSLAIAAPPGTPGEVPTTMAARYVLASGRIVVTYTPACDAASHTIYTGPLQMVSTYTYTDAVCSIGTSGLAQFIPSPESQFFLVVGNNAMAEGSYGSSSSGAERPEDVATPGCDRTQDLAGVVCE